MAMSFSKSTLSNVECLRTRRTGRTSPRPGSFEENPGADRRK